MLKRLKGWPTLFIDGYDLTIDDRLFGLQTSGGRRKSRVRRKQILVVTRTKLDRSAVLDDQRAIAIQLQLVRPVGPFRKSFDCQGCHRCDEAWIVTFLPGTAHALEHVVCWALALLWSARPLPFKSKARRRKFAQLCGCLLG
jgi:hypothetical protein